MSCVKMWYLKYMSVQVTESLRDAFFRDFFWVYLAIDDLEQHLVWLLCVGLVLQSLNNWMICLKKM